MDKMKKAHADFERLQKEYEDIFSNKTNGAKVRSRIQWWEEGEKSTKYFYGLEKRNAKEKAWNKIFDTDGKTILSTTDIQKRQVEYYKELYKSQNLTNNQLDTDFFLGATNQNKKLSNESREFLDSPLNATEISKALKKMQNNKSPGPDGIIVELYKLYWNVIGDDLYDVLINGLENKQLAYSQYLAVIILLYKKGPRPDIRNWRPISLLNSDYKLLSKVFAERLKSVMHEIIHPDQNGCIKGRYIGHNIRLIDDLLFEMENQNENAIILMLDQEKAFDRVEWNWLFGTLEHFNFGTQFIGYLKT